MNFFWGGGQFRRILYMSSVVGQAETFNYKTNYEAADVSPLTQPNPPRAEHDIF